MNIRSVVLVAIVGALSASATFAQTTPKDPVIAADKAAFVAEKGQLTTDIIARKSDKAALVADKAAGDGKATIASDHQTLTTARAVVGADRVALHDARATLRAAKAAKVRKH